MNVLTNGDNLQNLEDTQIVITSSDLTNERLEPAQLDIRGANLNPTILKDRSILKKHFHASERFWNETVIKFPWDYEDYLKILYGKNWSIPDEFYQV